MAETALQKEQLDFTDMPVGEILRRTRNHYIQSIEDIEKALCIRASQIEAIETGDMSAIPGRVYAIGFVRSYSEYLGLDGDKMVNLFKKQISACASDTELHFPVPASDSKLPPVWIILGCIALVVVILILWIGSNTENRKSVEIIPPVPEEMQIEDTQAQDRQIENTQVEEKPGFTDQPQFNETLAEKQVEQETIIQEKPKKGIILNIIENSWVEIRDHKGNTLISRVLKAGDQYYVPDRPDLAISIGNAGGVEIEVDGQKLQKLGQQAQVLRDLSLDAEYLKKNFALDKAE